MDAPRLAAFRAELDRPAVSPLDARILAVARAAAAALGALPETDHAAALRRALDALAGPEPGGQTQDQLLHGLVVAAAAGRRAVGDPAEVYALLTADPPRAAG
ncbi:hypothetical protein tb265_25190 [Gemmatimonadetes bacterium T265]|nr:hypothetical protein tb265_25190 [Gemmatimonadetes bacterium T265]